MKNRCPFKSFFDSTYAAIVVISMLISVPTTVIKIEFAYDLHRSKLFNI